ncbi:hypothetical protein [Hyphomicrobium sp.]|uniref:hypothetical protein n=1 Tax=Hyphomicrobium sp. TaxID=82 RepID=UPI001DD4D79B|nr:hypothetical protein [Hyphomicrobium sp.]MBY0561547.1 hypothetical protein [Hyphomicrobium sp.]
MKRTYWLPLFLILAVGGIGAADMRPDPDTWRTYNPAVTQETIATTICVPGYTASVRPPVYITQLIKKWLLEAQGLTWADADKYQLDHAISLSIGGEPGDLQHTSNFQLQLWAEAHRKDRLEIQAMRCVCAGVVTLEQARTDMENWQEAYRRYAKFICRQREAPAP